MIFGYFILLVALIIEAVGAYYSVTGLAAIFSGAVVPIIIMGGALEVGKVTAAVWLKMNWERANVAYKLYLVPAVAFLMVLTSMGIFGFLSKAHSDQSLVSGDSMAKVAIYDEKIKTSKDNIEANRKALKQMDDAVDQVMGRSTDEKGADKAVAIRRGQQKERARLQAEIVQEQTSIAKLNEEAAPLRAEFRKVENEVGPIKYIAALIYGDNPDQNILERAVRWVIILIVAVFDPLALVLILAAQQSLRWARGEDKEKPIEEKPVEEQAPAEPEAPVDLGVCPKCETPIVDFPGVGPCCPNKDCDVFSNVEQAREEKELAEFMWRGKMIAKGLDADEDKRVTDEANTLIAEVDPEDLDFDTILSDLEASRAEEQRLEQEALEQQHMLVNLAEQVSALETEVAAAKTVEVDLREKMLLAADALQENIDKLRTQQTILDTANNSLTSTQAERDTLLAEKGKLEIQIAQSGQWVEQLEGDLREAIQLAHDKSAAYEQIKAELDALKAEPVKEFLTVGDIERPGDYLVHDEPADIHADELEPPVLRDDNTVIYQGKTFNIDAFNTLHPELALEPIADNADITGTETQANFGTEFPKNQKKGDMFLRVDYYPNRLFKWNGVKWIEIDKDQTDRYAFDEAYIKLLVDKLQRGEYDIDDLNDTERAQVTEYLNNNAQ